MTSKEFIALNEAIRKLKLAAQEIVPLWKGGQEFDEYPFNKNLIEVIEDITNWENEVEGFVHCPSLP